MFAICIPTVNIKIQNLKTGYTHVEKTLTGRDRIDDTDPVKRVLKLTRKNYRH